MTIRSYQLQVQALVTPGSGGEITKSVSQSVSLTDEATFLLNTELLSVTQAVSLTDSLSFVLIPSGINSIVDPLGFTDEVSVFGFETVVDSLGLSDGATFDFGTLRLPVRNDLLLGQEVSYRYGVRNFFPEDDLGLTQSVGLVREFAVTDALGLEDFANFTGVVSTLSLSDSAEWGYGYDAESSLSLSQSVDVIQNLIKPIVDTVGLGQAVAYFYESRCSRFSFNTFHGEGGVAPKEKALNYTNKFLIQSIDTGQVVELRNPETDDRRRLAFNRVNRRFYDGTADVYSDPTWITEQTQIYTLTAIKRTKLEEVFQFLLDNLGREVLIKDWKGVTWIVMITNPGEVYTEDGEGYWTIDFEVQGEAVEGEYALQSLGLVQVPSRAGSIWARSGEDTAVLAGQALRNIEYPIGPSSDLSVTHSATYTVQAP